MRWRRWPAPGRPTSPASPRRRTCGRAATTACPPGAPARTRSRWSHDSERHAFRAQLATLGQGTTLLVDTFDVAGAVRAAVELAGPDLGAVRIDSGDLAAVARQVRALLDELGAHKTRIVLTGDLDEHSIAALATTPVDGYGVGTALVTGSGAPTAALVYKLVARSPGPGPGASPGAGGEAVGGQAEPWRPQVGGPAAGRSRHGSGRAGQPGAAGPVPGPPGAAPAAGRPRRDRRPGDRWSRRGSGTGTRSPSCPGTRCSFPGATRRSRP